MSSYLAKIGDRTLTINIHEGHEGFVEITDSSSEMSLHIRKEDDSLLAIHFTSGTTDPPNQINLDDGDIYID